MSANNKFKLLSFRKGGQIIQNIWENSPEVLKNFLLYMQTVKNKSEKTVDEYFLDLRTFFRFMLVFKNCADSKLEFEKIDISAVDIDFIKKIETIDIFEYMNFLIKVRKNNASARYRKTASLRAFFKYLSVKLKILENNPVKELDTPKLKKSVPKYMTLDESLKLLEVIRKYGNKNKERDYAIVTFFLNCGMRLSELVNINLKDIGSDNSLRILGKGNKERILYLNDSCLKALDDYKKVRGEAKDKEALFLSRSKTRISAKTIQFFMKKYFMLAGLSHKHLSTHKLRHTAATLMYQYGGTDIRVLKDILGHENISVTQIYTHTNPKQVKNAILNNPLSRLNN